MKPNPPILPLDYPFQLAKLAAEVFRLECLKPRSETEIVNYGKPTGWPVRYEADDETP